MFGLVCCCGTKKGRSSIKIDINPFFPVGVGFRFDNGVQNYGSLGILRGGMGHPFHGHLFSRLGIYG